MIYTVDIDGVPTVSFAASSDVCANGIVELDEFRSDLALMSSNGAPLCAVGARLQLRPASDAEVITYRSACSIDAVDQRPTFVFLVNVDGVIVHSVQQD